MTAPHETPAAPPPAGNCRGAHASRAPRTFRILVACEYSGRVRDAFRRRGFDARSVDLLPAEDGPTPWHIQDSIEHVLSRDPVGWDLAIFHPPCTYLANSGVRWLYNADGSENADRWDRMHEAADFFEWCLTVLDCPTAVENPVMHKHAGIRKPDFTVQPWQFGDPFKKRTCFWTRGLPSLRPTASLTAADAEAACHKAPPSPDRWKDRSRTYPGIAEAIAEQWGAVLHA